MRRLKPKTISIIRVLKGFKISVVFFRHRIEMFLSLFDSFRQTPSNNHKFHSSSSFDLASTLKYCLIFRSLYKD